jgi:ankyrin repeat protein
MKHANPA